MHCKGSGHSFFNDDVNDDNVEDAIQNDPIMVAGIGRVSFLLLHGSSIPSCLVFFHFLYLSDFHCTKVLDRLNKHLSWYENNHLTMFITKTSQNHILLNKFA